MLIVYASRWNRDSRPPLFSIVTFETKSGDSYHKPLYIPEDSDLMGGFDGDRQEEKSSRAERPPLRPLPEREKKGGENRWLLAVEAVWSEPVSGPISLFYREKTGNFVDSASNRRDRSLLTH